MRDYAKVAPQFWTGKTGKALRAKGQEALIVSLYLMTNPHANMLGLYYVPILFIAHETGLGMEGALKGLGGACEVGFCDYDRASEMVWVREMASYQVAEELKPNDNRVYGVQRDYDGLPDNPFLEAFYARYGAVFHMPSARASSTESDLILGSPLEAPPKPRTRTGAGTGAGAGAKTSSGDVEFDEAWSSYPARPGASKADTRRAWDARLAAGASPEAMIAGAKRYRAYCLALRTEPQFIKQPKTFFGPGLHYENDWDAGGPPRRSSHDLGRQDYTAGIDADGRIL